MARGQKMTLTLALVLAGPAGVVLATEVPFDAGEDVTTSALRASAVFVADVDGDGRPDILSASTDDDKIAWYRNTGTTPSTWPTFVITEDPDGPGMGVQGFANGATDVAAADIDGDGDLDIVAASRFDNHVSWFRNDGSPLDGGWDSYLINNIGDETKNVFVADIDGDGDPDVVSASETDDRLAWLENDGSLANWTATIVTEAGGGSARAICAGSYPNLWGIHAADLDHDGTIDIVSGAQGAGRVDVWYNDGTGTIWTCENVNGPVVVTGVESVAVADVNGDGDPDVITAATGHDTIAWWEPTLPPPSANAWAQTVISAALADGPKQVRAADLDGDGDVDVLSASNGDDRIAWYENREQESLSWVEHSLTIGVTGASDVATADFDRDGDLDVVASSWDDDAVTVFQNETIHRTAVFPGPNSIGDRATAHSVVTADFDNDGDRDVAITDSATGRVVWYKNLGMPGPVFSPGLVVDLTMPDARSVAAGDLDGDGDEDLVAASFSDDKVSWYENDGASSSEWTERVITLDASMEETSGARRVEVADVNGDGHLDVLSVTSSNALLVWYENDGTPGGEGDWVARAVGILPDSSVHAADIDGDGDTDLLAAASVPNQIRWYRNDGGIPLIWMPFIITDTAMNARFAIASDVDADGDLDVIAASAADNTIAWHENDGDPGGLGDWTEHVISLNADGAYSVGAADLDGDGDLDVLSTSAGDSKVAWYLNDGTPGGLGDWTERLIPVPTGTPGAWSVLADDIDADGDLDVVAASTTGGEIRWFANQGGQFALPTLDGIPVGGGDGATVALLSIVATHRGRGGDGDIELTSVKLLFEDRPGNMLSDPEVAALIEDLSIYFDDNSSGDFDLPDFEVTASLSLSDGVQTVTFTDGDPEVQVSFGSPKTYFVVVETTSDASTQGPCGLRVSHPVRGEDSTAEDRDHDIPLLLEPGTGQPSRTISFGPRVVSVIPNDNQLEVPVGTDVTVTFSEPVVAASITTSTFRLIGPGGLVPSNVTLSPSGLQATLDPIGALTDMSTLYTVEVTGVEDSDTCRISFFTSRFETEETVEDGTRISEVARQASSAPPDPSRSMAAIGAPENLGVATAAAGDVDDDGFEDTWASLPGYDDERGRVLLYLGDSDASGALLEPDLLLTGEAVGDRAGVAIVGNFDFDGNGLDDLLIGAEEIDRHPPLTGNGPGKVYLIFDVKNLLPVGGEPAWINLSDVGNGVPGVVFTGVRTGDQAGFALAAGGFIEPAGDTGPDIVIGAPGWDAPAMPTDDDRGAAYVIFDTDQATLTSSCVPATPCTIALDRIADDLPGVVYVGQQPKDGFGYAVAFPGDVTGSGGDALAIGAPAMTGTAAGKVYILPAGLETPAVPDPIEAGAIGIRIHGEQPEERFGCSVAGGGDNRQDGAADLLIGALGYDVIPPKGPPRGDAGRVVQFSTPLVPGDTIAGSAATTLNGAIWLGHEPGEALGFWVAGVGDVTGDSIDDIVLGAPLANPRADEDAGTAYLIQGPARTGLCTDTGTCVGTGDVPCSFDGDCASGTCDLVRRFACSSFDDCIAGDNCEGGERPVNLVEGTIAGHKLIGESPQDLLGYSVAGAGYVDTDDHTIEAGAVRDLAIGSPGWDSGTGDGALWLVVDLNVDPAGTCENALGCVAADLATGAQIEVTAASMSFPGSDTESARLNVKGMLAATAIAAPEGMMLVGAAEFELVTPDEVDFSEEPTVHIPVRLEVEDQLGDLGESGLELYSLDEGLWLPTGRTGTVAVNPHYSDRLAISAHIDSMQTYAVFVIDNDQDGFRPDSPAGAVSDCDDDSADTYPGAAPADSETGCMKDTDKDEYGDESVAGAVSPGTDCDDANDAISPGAQEVADDGIDQDCNGFDSVTCFVDADEDGYGDSATLLADDGDCTDRGEATIDGDCDDAVGDSWFLPSAVRDLELDWEAGTLTLWWFEPEEPGGSAALEYDTIRTDALAPEGQPDFGTGVGHCVEANGGTCSEGQCWSQDLDEDPGSGIVLYYLIRAENGCRDGGSLGEETNGMPRTALDCD